MGGTNTKDNLVLLTPEEHYVAHELLVKIFPLESKLVFGLFMMSKNTMNIRWKSNKIHFGWIKRKIAKAISALNKGRIVSEETKMKISETRKRKMKSGEIPLPCGELNGMFGKKMSNSSKLKMSIARKNKTWEEIYGEEKTKEMKDIFSKRLSIPSNNPGIGVCNGRKHSDETEDKLRKYAKNRTTEHQQKIADAKRGKHHFWSEEAKTKNRNKGKKVWIYNLELNLTSLILSSQVSEFILTGWVLGRSNKTKNL
jgi:hypothetical protein